MTPTTLYGGRILIPEDIRQNVALHFDSHLRALGPSPESTETMGRQVIQLPDDWIVAPGFVDIHIHGCSGHDVMDARPESLENMAQTLVKHGVTSFLATTMTMDLEAIERALQNARRYHQTQDNPLGSKMQGVHLEGPFISPRAIGAQNPDFILKPDLAFIEAYKDIIRIVTYAPEEDPELTFTKGLSDLGILPAIGHTACTYDMASTAYHAGATHMTHLFNAMTPLHHREPGAVGAALDLDFTLEIIADNVHIRPELYRMLHTLKNSKLALITDSMRAGCMKCGHYDLGGQKVVVDAHSARLENGALAGSILTMDQAVRNYIQPLSLKTSGKATPKPDALLADVLKAASTVPASIAGLNDTGVLKIGKRADLVILNAACEVQMTFVDGHLCYLSESASHLGGLE